MGVANVGSGSGENEGAGVSAVTEGITEGDAEGIEETFASGSGLPEQACLVIITARKAMSAITVTAINMETAGKSFLIRLLFSMFAIQIQGADRSAPFFDHLFTENS